MTYHVLADDGSPLDAHFDVEGDTIIFHSRGGTKGKDARNVDYARALRLLIQRLTDSGSTIRRAWMDSSRVQAMPIEDRVILDEADARLAPAEQVSRMGRRMQAIGRDPASKSDRGNPTKRIRLQLSAAIAPEEILARLRSAPTKKDSRSARRLRAADLRKVTPEHLFNAARRLLSPGATHDLGEPTDHDVLLEHGSRLPPQAVVKLAASEALGFDVAPRDLAPGLASACLRLLENAGYQIVAKGESGDLPATSSEVDAEWVEGSPKMRRHLRRERDATLPAAKKSQFKRLHGGRLFCERCGEDPVERYKTRDAEACIEVHHASVQVAQMREGHRSRLEDLQCLCANCHRLTHREMREAAKKKRSA